MKTKRTILIVVVLLAAIILGILIVNSGTGPAGTNPDSSTGSSENITGTEGAESTINGTESNPDGTIGDDTSKNPTEESTESTISGTETGEPDTGSDEPDTETAELDTEAGDTETAEPDTETTVPETEDSKPTTDSSDETQACAHTYGSWTTSKKATCESNGEQVHKCSGCGKSETEVIAATGHAYGSWSVTTKATCDEAGVESCTCKNCGKVEKRSIAATGHTWDEGKVTTKPTSCSDMGVITYTCKTCGQTKTDQITGEHSFGDWSYEDYTYKNEAGASRPSHRKVRSCTKCSYKEYGNTPDHYCAKGSANHTVTTVKAGTCTTKATMRSTCNVCGWYLEYEGKMGSHTSWTSRDVHISDYTLYTNELDATISTCGFCGLESVTYHLGEGYEHLDYSYRDWISIDFGDARAGAAITDDMTLVLHPEWQVVRRDFLFDSDGYVKQFTVYWVDKDGNHQSSVVKCGEGDMEAFFAEWDFYPSRDNPTGWTLIIQNWFLRPYRIHYM